MQPERFDSSLIGNSIIKTSGVVNLFSEIRLLMADPLTRSYVFRNTNEGSILTT